MRDEEQVKAAVAQAAEHFGGAEAASDKTVGTGVRPSDVIDDARSCFQCMHPPLSRLFIYTSCGLFD